MDNKNDCSLDNALIDARLARREGQVRGIRQMINDKRGCEEILMQLSSVSSAVTNAAKTILCSHVEHIVDGASDCTDTGEMLSKLLSLIDQFAKFK